MRFGSNGEISLSTGSGTGSRKSENLNRRGTVCNGCADQDAVSQDANSDNSSNIERATDGTLRHGIHHGRDGGRERFCRAVRIRL